MRNRNHPALEGSETDSAAPALQGAHLAAGSENFSLKTLFQKAGQDEATGPTGLWLGVLCAPGRVRRTETWTEPRMRA